jgi:hypothetical protein
MKSIVFSLGSILIAVSGCATTQAPVASHPKTEKFPTNAEWRQEQVAANKFEEDQRSYWNFERNTMQSADVAWDWISNKRDLSPKITLSKFRVCYDNIVVSNIQFTQDYKNIASQCVDKLELILTN